MRPFSEGIDLSATDLSNFLGCRHRTGLDLAVAEGNLKEPATYTDPFLELLRQRGEAHERAYADKLKADGLRVVDLKGVDANKACEQTVQAMTEAVDVIVQAAVCDGRWFGRPDILRRVLKPSTLGDWSYEVYDTKLALHTRGGTVLQLALYSELITTIQGLRPTLFHVITPDSRTPLHSYRLEDFAAYARRVRSEFLETIASGSQAIQESNYPESVEHCDMCRWFHRCDERRRKDDHLSFVAGISRIQRDELKSHGVTTLKALAELPFPVPFRPSRGAADTYDKVRHQAALQLKCRLTGQVVHDTLPVLPDRGLSRLPAPSVGDVFLDLEGAHFARDGGREYLFGLGYLDKQGKWAYQQRWAFSDAEEKLAFESIIDELSFRASCDPRMHIYHFAPYEPAALKRLMGRYATREIPLDDLLRAERFVDLLAITKHSVRASVESYSIKRLEVFFGFKRRIELREATVQRHIVERAVEWNSFDLVDNQVRQTVAAYNEEDCLATLELRRWLETLRDSLEAKGVKVPRPSEGLTTEQKDVDDVQKRAEALRVGLLAGVPGDGEPRNEEQHARYILAYLVDWHRRESKAAWWEYYRLRNLPESELLDERKAISGLEYISRIEEIRNKRTGKRTGSVVDRYSYPEQEMDLKPGDPLLLKDESDFGKVVAVDRLARIVDVRKGPRRADTHAAAAFSFQHFNSRSQQDAIILFAERVLAAGFQTSCQDDLLLKRRPRLLKGTLDRSVRETASEVAIRICDDLDRAVLAIQGPPGTGKTFTGARMICELVQHGRRVGVTGHSHEVIRNVLGEVENQRGGQTIRIGHKGDDDFDYGGFIQELDNDSAKAKLEAHQIDVVGGTSWLWSRPAMERAVDVLFVDEAGQMSLANVLAVGQAATNLVLLGDPQQLDQPQKGSHPDGVEVSALEHILGGETTISGGRGIFLDETWRLPPAICSFTSDAFYQGRLQSREGREKQRLGAAGPFAGAGLWIVPVPHSGNQNSSPEEVDTVDEIVRSLLGKASWYDCSGKVKPIDTESILVVAPYNAHVNRLQERCARLGVRIGTVDKFQGQQAPIVIYSMATSRPEDAPRGMEFLYSLNRLNVATSRPQCACILIANPALFKPDCRTPRQMLLANALCRYQEMANTVG